MWSAITNRFWEMVGGKDEVLCAPSALEPIVSEPVSCLDLAKHSQFCLRSTWIATIDKETF